MYADNETVSNYPKTKQIITDLSYTVARATGETGLSSDIDASEQ